MTQLGRGINELDVDGLELSSGGPGVHALSEDEGSLLGSDAGALDHDVVVLDDSVMGEASERGDVLLGEIVVGGGVVLDTVDLALTDAVDSLVGFGSVMVAELTGTGDSPSDALGMPSSDTTDSPETSMGLSRELLDSESLDDTGESVSLGDSEDVDVLEVVEDLVDLDFLLEERLGEVDLLGDGASVDLDFHNVSLLLSEVEETGLGVADDSDDGSVLLESVEENLESLGVCGELLFVLLEAFPLGTVPVLIETSLELRAESLGPDAGKASESSDSLNISDNTDDSDGRSFQNGNGLNDFLLVKL